MKQFVLILMMAFLSLVTEASPIVLVPAKDHGIDFPSQSFWCTIDFDQIDNNLTIELFQTGDLTILIADQDSGTIVDMVVYPLATGAGVFEYVVDAPTATGQYRINLVMGSATMYGDFEVN